MAFWVLVTPRYLVREVAVLLNGVCLGSLRLPVAASAPIFAVATASAAAAAAFFLLSLLAEPLEVEAALGRVVVSV